MRNKKGQLENLSSWIVVLVLAAVILVLGLVMTSNLQDSIDPVSVTITDQELGSLDATPNSSLTPRGYCDVACPTALTLVENASNAIVIDATNYTYYANDCRIINISDDVPWPWNITYTYTWGGEACRATNNTVTGLGSFADFWELIVLAIVVSVVLALVLMSFGKRRR